MKTKLPRHLRTDEDWAMLCHWLVERKLAAHVPVKQKASLQRSTLTPEKRIKVLEALKRAQNNS